MTTLNGATDAALALPVVTIAGLLEISFPGYTLRLCDGSGVVISAGSTFTGSDARFGTLADMGVIESGVGDSAPALEIGFLPNSTAAAVDLSAPAMQGSPVRVWLAVIDRATGAVVGAAERVFFGQIDTTELVLSRGQRRLNIQCVSGFERLFANQEGQRLADAFHQMIWPGETGLQNVTGITKNIPWGVAGPPRSSGYSTAAAGLGGGSGGTTLEQIMGTRVK